MEDLAEPFPDDGADLRLRLREGSGMGSADGLAVKTVVTGPTEAVVLPVGVTSAEVDTDVEVGAAPDPELLAEAAKLTGRKAHFLACRLRLESTPNRRPHVSHWKAGESIVDNSVSLQLS